MRTMLLRLRERCEGMRVKLVMGDGGGGGLDCAREMNENGERPKSITVTVTNVIPTKRERKAKGRRGRGRSSRDLSNGTAASRAVAVAVTVTLSPVTVSSEVGDRQPSDDGLHSSHPHPHSLSDLLSPFLSLLSTIEGGVARAGGCSRGTGRRRRRRRRRSNWSEWRRMEKEGSRRCVAGAVRCGVG